MKRCYYIIESHANEAGNPLVAIVEENEAGYYPTDIDWGPLDSARRIANKVNEEMGITVDDFLHIIASSMVAQRFKKGTRL